MTKPQLLAMTALFESAYPLSPSSIGYAMTPNREHPLKRQGAGRLGGTMMARLWRLGWVCCYGADPIRYMLTIEGELLMREKAMSKGLYLCVDCRGKFPRSQVLSPRGAVVPPGYPWRCRPCHAARLLRQLQSTIEKRGTA